MVVVLVKTKRPRYIMTHIFEEKSSSSLNFVCKQSNRDKFSIEFDFEKDPKLREL